MSSSWAQEIEGAYFTEWRIIKGDRSEATSNCIGDFKSPSCVFDTLMACGIWSRKLFPEEYPKVSYGMERDYEFAPECASFYNPKAPNADSRHSIKFPFPVQNLSKYQMIKYRAVFWQVTDENMSEQMHADLDYMNKRIAQGYSRANPRLVAKPGDVAAVSKYYICQPKEEFALPRQTGENQHYSEKHQFQDCKTPYVWASGVHTYFFRKEADGSWLFSFLDKPYRDPGWSVANKMFYYLVN